MGASLLANPIIREQARSYGGPAAAHTVQALAAAPASLLVMPTLPGSEEDQKTRSIIGQQVRHITGMHAHKLLDGFGGAIAPSDPYYPGWRTPEGGVHGCVPVKPLSGRHPERA